MRKTSTHWTLSQLIETYPRISFPEYQREATVWSRLAKQRLIDSIARQFDVGALYFYAYNSDSIDCIDGRQRLGAIMSFLGLNHADPDNGFEYRVLNEVFEDDAESAPFRDLDHNTITQIRTRTVENVDQSTSFLSALMSYPLTIVTLEQSVRAEEFNLQFTRLNFGTIINSGELLHAMVGDLRDEAFKRIGQHQFFGQISIPTRRYAKEQLAAQIIAQLLSMDERGQYARTRHADLMGLFKRLSRLSEKQSDVIAQLVALLDVLAESFHGSNVLRNRALTLSTVLLAAKENIDSVDSGRKFAGFIEEFAARVRWQVSKGSAADQSEYSNLLLFQRYMTQASVERPAVEGRASILADEYHHWLAAGKLSGDAAYFAKTNEDPSAAGGST